MNSKIKTIILVLFFHPVGAKNKAESFKYTDLSREEIEYIKNSKEDIVYINNDTRRIVNNLCTKEIIKDPKNYLYEFCKACKSDWKVVPSRVAHYAMDELKQCVETNKIKLSEKKYDRVNNILKNYESNLQNKEAQFFFATDKTTIDTRTFNNLYVNDKLIARNLFQVNNQEGKIGFRVGVSSGDERVLSRLPVRINFEPTGDSPNSFVVIGTAVLDSLNIKTNQVIDGALNVGGNITVQNSPVVLDAQNVGSGTGLIFQDKSGNTLNLRSLVAGNNIIFDTSNNNQITISAIGTGLGDVTGPASSTDTAIAIYDGTTGKVIQNTGVTINGANEIFTPGQIIAPVFNGSLNGNASTATFAASAQSAFTASAFTDPLAGDVTGTQFATVVANVPDSATINGTTANNVVVNTGASTDTAIATFNGATGKVIQSTGVTIDGANNISTSGSVTAAGGFIGSLSGTADSAFDFLNPLAGDVTGPQTNTVVASVGGASATLVANAADAVNSATAANVAGTLVQRDGSGDFSTGSISLSENLILQESPSTNSLSAGYIIQGGATFLHNKSSITNLFAGLSAGSTQTSTRNTGLGFQSIQNFQNAFASDNTAVGYQALGTATTVTNVLARNTAIGSSAMTNSDDATLGFTPSDNTCVGYSTLINNVGNSNTAVGSGVLNSLTQGSNNTGIGFSALSTNLVTGSRNTALGFQAGVGLGGNSSDTILIGNTGTNADNALIRIGDGATHTDCYIAGINGATSPGGSQVLIAADGKLGTVVSSKRYKKDVEDLEDESEKIYDLRPVKFKYKSDKQNSKQYGLIAEDVKEVLPDLVINNKDDQPETVKYHYLPILLLNELKKSNNKLNELNNKYESLKKEIEKLKNN